MAWIQVLEGDSRKILEEKALALKDAILVSDPPYNVGYHYDKYEDKMSENDYFEMLRDVFGDYSHVMIHYPESLYRHAIKIGKAPDRVVSWCYNTNLPRQHRDIAFFGVKPDFRKVGQDYKNPKDKRVAKLIAEGRKAKLYDFWQVEHVRNVSAEKTEHPCQIPLEVMRRIIGILPPDRLIVDPFLGSGTTGVACALLGRDFLGIELDPKYVDISKKRIAEARQVQKELGLK
jgi:DNA modification methylase